jgi:hypothetical protein
VAALPNNFETSLFQSANRLKMIYAGQLRHKSNSDFHLTNVFAFQGIGYCGKIILNCFPDILEGFTFGRALRPTTGKSRTTDRVALLGLD